MLRNFKLLLAGLGALIRKYTPLSSKDDSIEDILNYQKYSDTISSSGQPTKNQFALIRKAGFEIVINLAPYKFFENYLKDEEAIVTGLGMKYVHIPVQGSNPTNEDFEKFVNAMQNASGPKVWVHCAVNARASAFMYKYRCYVLGVDKQVAIWDLREIWEPFGVWKKFVFDE